jgi:hypothetical protein
MYKLKEKINLLWFRHSQIDPLFRTEGINEYDLKIFAVWTPTSNTMVIYFYYYEDCLNDKILQSKGKTLELKYEDDNVLNNKI